MCLQDKIQSDERNIYQEMDEDPLDKDSDLESLVVLCSPGKNSLLLKFCCVIIF